MKPADDAVKLGELVPVRELHKRLKNIFPSRGSLDWELRANRKAYVDGGAVFELAGRLMAHPGLFERVALKIASEKVASRIPGRTTVS